MVNDASFVNEQTNVASTVCGAAATTDCLSLAEDFPRRTHGSYALDPRYRLPYVMAWNLDVQKTLPWGLVLNAGTTDRRAIAGHYQRPAGPGWLGRAVQL